MANELSISASISFSKNGTTISLPSASKRRDVAGDEVIKGLQNIGTSEEAIEIGGLDSLGYVRLRNTDTDQTKYIRVGTATTVYQLRLYGGDVALFRPNNGAGVATALYAIANGTAQDLEFYACEP